MAPTSWTRLSIRLAATRVPQPASGPHGALGTGGGGPAYPPAARWGGGTGGAAPGSGGWANGSYGGCWVISSPRVARNVAAAPAARSEQGALGPGRLVRLHLAGVLGDHRAADLVTPGLLATVPQRPEVADVDDPVDDVVHDLAEEGTARADRLS